MKTFTFNDLLFQIFVLGLLVLLVRYLSFTMPQFQMHLSWGIPADWLREAWQSIVTSPLRQFAK